MFVGGAGAQLLWTGQKRQPQLAGVATSGTGPHKCKKVVNKFRCALHRRR